MVKIRFLGGGCEVGRMGITLDNGDERFLLEYGINVDKMDVPIEPKMPIDALLLSHPHLDHSGNIPTLYANGWKGRVYATPATFEIMDMLLKDSLKVQKIKGLRPKYGPEHVSMVNNRGVNAQFGKPKKFKSAEVTFNNAGHVPGSSSILIETGGKRILFTGDIKFEDTFLMKGAYQDFHDIDVLITESTYSYKNHPKREETAEKIRDLIEETIGANGFALLPCFAVGRSQEMLLLVADMGIPIVMDGMGIGASRAALAHPKSIRDHAKLSSAFKSARKVRSNRQRKEVLKSPCIIITTAGMLSGGPVHFYLKHLHARRDSTMILNGFQVPGTVGRTLIDSGMYVHEDMNVKPKMRVEFVDLSAHCGRDPLINFIKKVNPKKTFLIHGEKTEAFANTLKKMGFDAIAPKNGESFEV